MNRISRFAAAAVLALVATATMPGCGESEGPTKVVVDGAVTWQGEPIDDGEIRFYPIEGTAGPVSGAPIEQGKYTADGRGGVPVGTHRVEIEGFRPPANASNGPQHAEGGPADQYVTPEYNTHSELTVTVDGDNTTHDFNLPLEE